MNARDKLLKLVDDDVVDANLIIRELLVNYLDIDSAINAAESILADYDMNDWYNE